MEAAQRISHRIPDSMAQRQQWPPASHCAALGMDNSFQLLSGSHNEKNSCDHCRNAGENSQVLQAVVAIMAMKGSVSGDCIRCRVGGLGRD